MLCNTDLFDYRPKILRLLQSIAIAGACVVAISFAAADESQPDPKSTPNELPGDAVEILVERLEAFLQPASLTRSTLRINLTLNVTNLRPHPVPISLTQFTIVANGASFPGHATGTSESLQKGALGPGESSRGVLTFAFVPFVPEEQPLILKWTEGAEQAFVILNDVLRVLHPFPTERKGPGQRLAIIRASSSLDILSTWPLHDRLRQLQQDGVARVVIAPGVDYADASADSEDSNPADPENTLNGDAEQASGTRAKESSTIQRKQYHAPSNQKSGSQLEITEEAMVWLSPLTPGSHREGAFSTIHAVTLAPFVQLQVAGFQHTQSRRLVSVKSTISILSNEADAVTRAAQSCYERLPADEAFESVFQSDAGLRRAALNATIDRLNAAQIDKLLTFVQKGDRDDKLVIIPYLSRLTADHVIELLSELSQSPDVDISLAALTSLMGNDHPQTVQAVGLLWERAEENRLLRQTIVAAAMNLHDYRWNDLLANHANQLLRFFAAQIRDPFVGIETDTSVSQRTEDAASENIDDPNLQGSAGNSQHAVRLKALLKVLPANEYPILLEAARETVLQISDHQIQDSAMQYIRLASDDADRRLVEKYLEMRLASGAISDTVADAAYRYPGPEWTDQLLKLAFNEKTTNGSLKRKALTYALRGANLEQLNSIVEQLDPQDPYVQGMVLKHLAGVDHPKWSQMAADLLQKQNSAANDAIDILALNGSENSIALLNDRLRSLIESETDFDHPAEASQRSFADRLITKLGVFSHPEVYRTLNRCMRHKNRNISETTMRVLSALHRRSPAYSLIEDAVALKKQKKYAEALEKSAEATETDPFSPDALLYRASLFLRDDRLDVALADLTEADQLNPEEPSTLNTIALVLVRKGQLENGLKMAEETLKLDPDEDSNLYNTCCVFARASEQGSDDQSKREPYRNRAFELLEKSVANGFDDLDHLLNDPDLDCLHDSPRWAKIVDDLKVARSKIPPP